MDKVLHLIAGAVIGAFFMSVADAMWAVLAVILAAVGKEVFDYFRHGHPDPMDAVATVAGGLVVIAAMGVGYGF